MKMMLPNSQLYLDEEVLVKMMLPNSHVIKISSKGRNNLRNIPPTKKNQIKNDEIIGYEYKK